MGKTDSSNPPKPPALPLFANLPKLDVKSTPQQFFTFIMLLTQNTESWQNHNRWRLSDAVLVPHYLTTCITPELANLIQCESLASHAYPNSVAELFK
eukprot:2077546-Karenia_brevis.AAC.1